MKVKIPFKSQFKDVLLIGKKTWTSRTKRYGKEGDIFEAFGQTFMIDEVMLLSLKVVAFRFDLEGFRTESDFIECWKQIHPRKGWCPDQKVWVHEFQRQGKET